MSQLAPSMERTAIETASALVSHYLATVGTDVLSKDEKKELELWRAMATEAQRPKVPCSAADLSQLAIANALEQQN